jgi:hypothetical protein
MMTSASDSDDDSTVTYCCLYAGRQRGPNVAARYGHLRCLKYMHRLGYEWNEETGLVVIYDGEDSHNSWRWHNEESRLACLKYLHVNGYLLRADMVTTAIKAGQAKLLEYLLDNACPVDVYRVQGLRLTIHIVLSLRDAIPALYHHGITLKDAPARWYRDHVQEHTRRSVTLLKCAVSLIGWYNDVCHRRYAPGGTGYNLARADFQKLMNGAVVSPDRTDDGGNS